LARLARHCEPGRARMLHRKTPGAPDYAKGAPHVRVGGLRAPPPLGAAVSCAPRACGGIAIARGLLTPDGVRPTCVWGD